MIRITLFTTGGTIDGADSDKGTRSFFLAITLLLLFRGEELYAEQSIACSVPAKSIKAQINDFCFLQFETDDVAHL
jgi:hypothetical protein